MTPRPFNKEETMDYTKMKGCHPGGDPVGLKGPDGMNTISSYQAGMDDMKTIIRNEIERRIELIKPRPVQGYILCQEMTKMLQSLLSFLDTLQEQEVKEQKSQDTVGRVSIEIRSNLQTDEVVRKTLIMLVNDGRISVKGAITSSDILNWLEKQKKQKED